jgi:hypothetical protein
MGTGSFPGVQRPGRGVDHPPTSSAEVKVRVELYLYFPSGPSWPVIGYTLPLLKGVETKQQRNDQRRGRTVNICASYSEVHGLFLSVEKSSLQFFVILFGPSKQIP